MPSRGPRQVTVWFAVYEKLKALASASGIGVTTLVNGILSAAVAFEEAFLRGGLPLTADPGIVVRDARTLLERALSIPIRERSVYHAAEVTGLLGLGDAQILEWSRKGFLRTFKSRESARRFVVGAELLRFLMHQASLAMTPVAIGATAAAMLEADSAPAPAEG